MTERKIIVSNPNINTDAYRNFSEFGFENTHFPRIIKERGIYATTHPRAVDLAAGNSPWSVRLINNGWLAENITCIDIAIPDSPFIEGLKWLYWDTNELGHTLASSRPCVLPDEVEKLKEAFDIIVTSYGGIGVGFRHDELVCDFLAKDKAFIWANGDIFVKGQDHNFPRHDRIRY